VDVNQKIDGYPLHAALERAMRGYDRYVGREENKIEIIQVFILISPQYPDQKPVQAF
jgi:hypothetical protein